MWNVKHKDDRMDQKTLHYCYGNYMITNQQTLTNKIYWHDFASLPCHIVFKDFSKIITCYLISLSLIKVF